nr:hypothetical protein [Tanacetum cinerariifolium]
VMVRMTVVFLRLMLRVLAVLVSRLMFLWVLKLFQGSGLNFSIDYEVVSMGSEIAYSMREAICSLREASDGDDDCCVFTVDVMGSGCLGVWVDVSMCSEVVSRFWVKLFQ